MKTYGHSRSRWNAAKEEARQAMIRAAKDQTTIYYSELVQLIHSIEFRAHNPALFRLLGQVSTDESQAGRGMLSAVVVRKKDRMPGPGFFRLAGGLGYDSSEQNAFWVSQLNKVYSVWSGQ